MTIQPNVAIPGQANTSQAAGREVRAIGSANSQSDAKAGGVVTEPEQAQANQPAATAASAPVETHRLDNAIQTLSEKMPLNPNELQFSLDEDSGKMVITVIDPKTEEVIRQLPPEEALQLARTLSEMNDADTTTALGLFVNSEA